MLRELKLKSKQILISVAAGISFEELAQNVADKEMTMFRIIPNTAVSEMESMTLIASRNATPEQEQLMLDIFQPDGPLPCSSPEEKNSRRRHFHDFLRHRIRTEVHPGSHASRHRNGHLPPDGMRMVAQTVKGAAELILNNDTHPSVEIDKVCTPGGITIRGINELEHGGLHLSHHQRPEEKRVTIC